MNATEPKAQVTGPEPMPRIAAMFRNVYLLAVLSVLAALVGTLALRSVVPDQHLSFVLFFAAVAVSAGLGGLWAGVLATILSALICDYFFLTPFHTFVVASRDLPLLILFIFAAALINGVSGRLRAQTRLADQRYYSLVQGLDGIVWEMNPRTGRYTFVSRRAEILLGYPVRKWLDDPGFRRRITHPADAARVADFWQDAIAAGGEHSADYRVLTADGRELWLRETVYVGRDARGRPNRLTGLAIDITARKSEAEERIRISRQLVMVQESERRAIARELHDEIGQVLTGLKLTLEATPRLPGGERPAELQTGLGLVQDLIAQVEGISLDLRPAMLDDLGLLPALHWHCRRYTALTGIHIQIEHTGVSGRFLPVIEIAAYRIVQEALTNVARHAGVDSVTVRLWANREILGIQIADGGKGFDIDSVLADPTTSGLAGMKERATLLDGHLTIETGPGAGTSVTVDLPLAQGAEEPTSPAPARTTAERSELQRAIGLAESSGLQPAPEADKKTDE